MNKAQKSIVILSRKISFLVANLLICLSAFSQQYESRVTIPGVLETKFLRDSLTLDEKGFAFNSLTIKNLKAEKLDVVITPDLKEKIQSVNPIPQNISLQPNETKVIPLRFNLVNSTINSGSFRVLFTFSLPATSQNLFSEFSVRIQKNTKWRSSVDRNTIIFKGGETELPFNLTIDNRGNSPENYEIRFDLSDKLQIKGQKSVVTVEPNKSKTLAFTIENGAKAGQPINIQNTTVEVYVKNQDETRKYNIEVIKLGSVYTEYLTKMKKMPLTLELNANNIGNPNPYLFGRVYGTMNINENERLRVYYQSDNYFRTGRAESFIGFAEYSNRKFGIHLGSIQEFNNFQVDGIGARLQFRSKHSETEGYVVNGRNQTTRVANFNNTVFTGRKWSNTTKAMYYEDRINLLKSGIAENELGFALNKKTQFSVMGGASLEQTGRKIIPEQQRGYAYGYQLDHIGEKWTYNSIYKQYSSEYAGFNKGFQYQQHRIKFQPGRFFLQLSYDVSIRNQLAYSESALNQFFNLDSKIAGINFGFLTEKGTISLGPAHMQIRQDSASAFTAKSSVINLNIFHSIGNSGVFSLISQTGFANVPSALYNKKIFTSTNFGSLGGKNFGVQYRFDHGPIYYYELSQFIKSPTLNTTRYQISPYVDMRIDKWNMYGRVQYTMNREFISNAKDDYVYYQFQWKHPKSKWETIISGQYNFVSQQRTFLNFTYRRQLNVPLLKNRKIKSADFVFYKDINNNGTYDAGDQLLSDMQLLLNKSLLLTDKQGRIQITNTDDDILNFDFSNSNNTQGWIPLNGLKQSFTVKSKNNTQYIAFKKGKLLKGVVTLVKDANSTLDFSVANIRVTAQGSDGTKYTAITDAKGEFYFNVVSGTYLVSLPEVFDDVFKPTEFTKTADLVLNESVNLVFEVRQKRRNVNIKKN